MTCWIEDELHKESHGGPMVDAVQRIWKATMGPDQEFPPRPCGVFCREGLHATVVFCSSNSPVASHVLAQMATHHPWAVGHKAEPAHEVTPEMYPERVHRGTPGEGEKLIAWLVFFRSRKEEVDAEVKASSVDSPLPDRAFRDVRRDPRERSRSDAR